MAIEIGKQIKNLRIEKGVTQEELANHLGISYQAVSKWENNITAPDIELLPKLSVYFGVTIDELFVIPSEVQMERIENIICNERIISPEVFNYAVNFLENTLKDEPKDSKAYFLLGELYNHRAENDHKKAAIYIKEALKYEPYEKEYHGALIHAENGVFGDEYYNRHDGLIKYYEKFTKEHPNYWSGHLFYLDQLIRDGHYDKARDTLKKVKKIKHTPLDFIYEGDIEFQLGNKESAIKLWNQGVNEFPLDWKAYISRGDRMVRVGNYDRALRDYEKSMELQEKPRIVDPLEFMAWIYEILGNYKNAVEVLQREISILQEEYNIYLGEMVDKPKREIERLKKYYEEVSI
ncbi:helix-turn-helix domain-containing protein [Haloimpatiens lingqiaonensis]|uniref:helix-turn-helix domain-containing protein n=1 Tax=Haloimpatiens lingqiaonensis TaxID=1380675 RepID=UPI0010FEF907|nr:helix-turn-helix domain-containing protein [Haloimpatiens lingqiaonensis]